MTAFDATAEEHNPPQIVRAPGRHVVEVVEAFRLVTKGGQSIVIRTQVLIGECEGERVGRLCMIDGKGTRWFANLLKSLGRERLADIGSDAEVSKALTSRPFAVTCAWGRVIRDDNGETKMGDDNKPARYMEIRDFYPINDKERATLMSRGYVPSERVDVFVEPPSSKGSAADDYEPDNDLPF